jgi:hypothetical protein
MLKKTTQWELAVEQLFLACPTPELFVEQFYPKASFGGKPTQ